VIVNGDCPPPPPPAAPPPPVVNLCGTEMRKERRYVADRVIELERECPGEGVGGDTYIAGGMQGGGRDDAQETRRPDPAT
jgi:hypothetical protein